MNQSFEKDLLENNGPLSFDQIQSLIKTELAFFQNYYSKDRSKIKLIEQAGPSCIFGRKGSHIEDKGSGIILAAAAQECSELAKQNIFLYRGTNLKTDTVLDTDNTSDPYSLSFGLGLFSMAMWDRGAIPYSFIKSCSYGYILPIPLTNLEGSCFYIPKAEAIPSLLSCGEFAHARTGYWKEATFDSLRGVAFDPSYSGKTEHLESPLTKEEFISQFERISKNAIYLKSL